jgi:hypothetical protein
MAYGQDRTKTPRALGAVFALIGLVLLGVAAYFTQKQLEIIRTWPLAEAEVVSSEVTYHRSRDDGGTTYGVRIEFRYTVAGREYTAPATLGYTTSSFSSMQREADRHPAGSRHLIHHNPAAPQDIRFNAGYNWGFFLVPLIAGGLGVAFTGAGLSIVFKARKAGAERCASCGQFLMPGQRQCSACGTYLPSE